MRRRGFLAGASALLTAPALRLAADTPGGLLEAARRLAAAPHQPASSPLPAPFAGLDYDAYRGIRPIPGKAAMLPHGDAFAMDLLPPGLYFPDPVRIDIERDGALARFPFFPSALLRLRYRFPLIFGESSRTAARCGLLRLRLRHPLTRPAAGRWVVVSSFRAASLLLAHRREEHVVYWLVRRAVAIRAHVAAPARGMFRWLHAPFVSSARSSGRSFLDRSGLIDSRPSLCGHLRHERFRPGPAYSPKTVRCPLPSARVGDPRYRHPALTVDYLIGSPPASAVSDAFPTPVL